MLIEDDRCFSLVVPTYEGTPFLRRLLDYLKAGNYLGHVLLSDNSSGEHRAFVESCPARYPELWLEVDAYEGPIGFLDKLARSLAKLQARHVMLCAQDDFFVPAAVENLVALLEADDGLACARGHVARFLLRPLDTDGAARRLRIDLNKHAMLPYADADPLQRVLAHLRAYTSTLYSVHRREPFLDCLRITAAATQSVVFFQYLQSCVTVALGRVACTDELFLARQVHARSWSATMLEGDYEHWPLLATSPKYSGYYAGFRDTLAGVLADRLHAGERAAIGALVDREFPALVRRSFCRSYPSDAASDAFFARLHADGSSESTCINGIAKFCMPYPDTY